MKKLFLVSLCKNGILGGNIVADDEKITYHTGKLTVPEAYRNLEMRYNAITSVKKDGWLLFPTVTLQFKTGESYKFLVFARKRFLRTLNEMGVTAI